MLVFWKVKGIVYGYNDADDNNDVGGITIL